MDEPDEGPYPVQAMEADDITTEGLNDITTEGLNDITPEELNDITTEELNGITTDELNDITTEGLNDITPEELNDITTEELNDITTEELNDITTEELTETLPDKSIQDVLETYDHGTDFPDDDVRDHTSDEVMDVEASTPGFENELPNTDKLPMIVSEVTSLAEMQQNGGESEPDDDIHAASDMDIESHAMQLGLNHNLIRTTENDENDAQERMNQKLQVKVKLEPPESPEPDPVDHSEEFGSSESTSQNSAGMDDGIGGIQMYLERIDEEELLNDPSLHSQDVLSRLTNVPFTENDGLMASCEFCHILMPDSMMPDHVRIHQELDEPLPCPRAKCPNEFLTAFDLKNHILSIHPGGKDLIPHTFTCSTCGKEMRMLSAFQSHAKFKHPASRVKCIREPMLTRNAEGEFVCPVCVKTCPTRKAIVKHLNDAHQLGVKESATIMFGSDQIFIENEFDEGAFNEHSYLDSPSSSGLNLPWPNAGGSLLREVLNLKTSGQGAPAVIGDSERIVCPECNEVYFDMSAFKRHYYRHTVRYTCRVCNKKILGMNEYRDHCQQKHIMRPRAPGEVRRTCPYCGKSFIDLNLHIKKHETACELCGLQFVHLGNMTRHYLDVHGIDLHETAPQVDGRTKRTSVDVKIVEYKKAMAIAEKEPKRTRTPVREEIEKRCEYCSRIFKSKESYDLHIVTHNQKCKICQLIIENEADIRPHLKQLHGINDVDNVRSLVEPTITEHGALNQTTRTNQSMKEPTKVGQSKIERDQHGRRQCKICWKKVIDFAGHMLTHNVQCCLCDFVSVYRHNLRPHMKDRHGLDDDEIDLQMAIILSNTTNTSPTSRAPSTITSAPRASPYQQRVHTPKLQPRIPVQVDDALERFQCHLCQKSVVDLPKHMTTHNVRCRMCDKTFLHQASIYGHMKLIHGIIDTEIIRANTIPGDTSPDTTKFTTLKSPPAGKLTPPVKSMPSVKPIPPVKSTPPVKSIHTTPENLMVARKMNGSEKKMSPKIDVAPIHNNAEQNTVNSDVMKKCKVCKENYSDRKSHMATHYKPCALCEIQFHPQGFRNHLKSKHGITDPAAVRSLEEDDESEEERQTEPVLPAKEEHDCPSQPTVATPTADEYISTSSVTMATMLDNSPTNLASITGQCKYCHKAVRDLGIHMRTRHNLKCSMCSTVIRHFGNAKAHLTNIHGIENPDIKSLTIPLEKEPIEALGTPHDLNDPLEVSNSVLDLSFETRPVTPTNLTPEGRVKCEYCDQSFKARKYYAQHCRNIHKIKLADKRKYKTNSYPGASDMDSSDGLGAFDVSLIGSRTAKIPKIGDNMTNTRIHTCQLCSTMFMYRGHLAEHMKAEHGASLDDDPSAIDSDGGAHYSALERENMKSSTESSCEDESEGFDNQRTADSEAGSSFLGSTKSSETSEARLFQCDMCPKNYFKARYLYRHLRSTHGDAEPGRRLKAKFATIHASKRAGQPLTERKAKHRRLDTSSGTTSNGSSAIGVAKQTTDTAGVNSFLSATVENDMLAGVVDQSEINRRRRLLSQQQRALTVGGLGHGHHRCNHCHRRFASTSSRSRHIKTDSCPVLILRRQQQRQKMAKQDGAAPSQESASPGTGVRSQRQRVITQFRCDICNITLSSSVSLERHLLTHTNDKPIKCYSCRMGFNQNIHLRTHLLRYHNIPMDASRNIGIQNESIQRQLARMFGGDDSSAKIDGNKCMVCDKILENTAQLRAHLTEHTSFRSSYSKAGPLKVKISMTPMRANAQLVQNDEEEVEVEEEEEEVDVPDSNADADELPVPKDNLACSKCMTPIKSIDENIAHNSRHKSCATRNYCFVCWVPFSNLRSLVRHFLTIHTKSHNTGVTNKKCPFCPSRVVNLNKHVRHSHPGRGIDQKQCACHLCGKSFIGIIQRKVHMIVRHPKQGKKIKKNVRKRKESISESELGTIEPVAPAQLYAKPLQKHYVEALKQWCDICNCSVKSLMTHAVVHSGIKTHDCAKCGRPFTKRESRDYHMQKCETGRLKLGNKGQLLKSGMCLLCKCEVRGLDRHMASVHAGQTTFNCDTCGRMFNRKDHLKTHLFKAHGLESLSSTTSSRPASRLSAVGDSPLIGMKPDLIDHHVETIDTVDEDDVQLMDVRVLLKRCDMTKASEDRRNMNLVVVKQEPDSEPLPFGNVTVKDEPEDWTLTETSNDYKPTDERGSMRSLTPSAAVSPTDARPSIFEVMTESDTGTNDISERVKAELGHEGKTDDCNESIDTSKTITPRTMNTRQRASPATTKEDGVPRYVKCAGCSTYLLTRKTEEQLKQFKLLCNSCLKVPKNQTLRDKHPDRFFIAEPETVGQRELHTTARKSTSGRRTNATPDGSDGTGSPTVSHSTHSDMSAKDFSFRSKNKSACPFVTKARQKVKAHGVLCKKCGMKYMNNAALQSHIRNLHTGPERLKDGITLTNSNYCDFCGEFTAKKGKNPHLRAAHPELFVNGLFNRYSEKVRESNESAKARARTLIDGSEMAVSGDEYIGTPEVSKVEQMERESNDENDEQMAEGVDMETMDGADFASVSVTEDVVSDSDDDSDDESFERNYKCSNCEKAYSKASSLIVHIRLHTGQNPYECPFCADSFYCKRALRGHMSDAH